MRYILILAFSICFLSAHAQRVTVAPTSFKAWGGTTGYSSIGFHYGEFIPFGDIGIHYFHPYEGYYWYEPSEGEGFYARESPFETEEGKTLYPKYATESSFALSYSPINIYDILRVGVMMFDTPFPIKSGKRLNVLFELGYTYKRFRLSYIHISNAYRGDINPGIDFITISYHLFD